MFDKFFLVLFLQPFLMWSSFTLPPFPTRSFTHVFVFFRSSAFYSVFASRWDCWCLLKATVATSSQKKHKTKQKKTLNYSSSIKCAAAKKSIYVQPTYTSSSFNIGPTNTNFIVLLLQKKQQQTLEIWSILHWSAYHHNFFYLMIHFVSRRPLFNHYIAAALLVIPILFPAAAACFYPIHPPSADVLTNER